MEEVWRPVDGYEGLYEVSNLGRVRTLPKIWYNGKNHATKQSKPSVLLKGSVTIYGYACVQLSKNGRVHGKMVHRLVADAFLPKTKDKNQVNHIDGNKINNKLQNLEWCTAKENTDHAIKIGLKVSKKGEGSTCCKLSEADVIRIRELYGTGKYRQGALAEEFGVSRSNINNIVNRYTWTHI